MNLPVMPPMQPMLARLESTIPPGMQYEPKWDGFRCLVFRDGDDIVLESRTSRPLARYFPEIVEGVRTELPRRCVLDGEIVVVHGGRVDFDLLQQRIHPAASRIQTLAARTPALFVAFDLLALDDENLLDRPLRDRFRRLAEILDGGGPRTLRTPATDDEGVARYWFDALEGAGLDGIVAKSFDLRYQPGKRVMVKIKHERTADCVVAGLRWYRGGEGVGSLLLGLYDDDGILHHVGVCGAFPHARRRELATQLAPLITDPSNHPWGGGVGRVPGTPSRWSAAKNLDWTPLRPVLVCEVGYDFMDGGRFRHTTQFRRWRPDRDPRSCDFGQLPRPPRVELFAVLDTPPPPGRSAP